MTDDLRSAKRAPVIPENRVRTDIQALRAFAVMAVVFYHIWPGALPGGYIGVDVFFVISGYLITGQLLRARATTSGLVLRKFWASRARRLLPASLTVLLISAILTMLFAPDLLQGQYLRSVLASTLYVENWQLAFDAVDYLAADNSPPIAQHYWSLSVEEQFYVIWPLLILLVGTTSSRRLAAGGGSPLLWVVTALSLLSFTLCVWTTLEQSPFAYFSTFGRIWEFGLGAIVAVTGAWVLRGWIRATLWIGSGVVLVASAFLITSALPFPGPTAAIPTVATAVLLGLGPRSPFSAADRVIELRAIQWLGNESYGIYLWHWPLIVIAPAILGRPTDLAENLTILALTFVLAWATKRLIEDPIRFGSRSRSAPPWKVGVASLAAMTAVVASSAIPIGVSSAIATDRAAEIATEISEPGTCLGAAFLLEDGCNSAQNDSITAAELVPPVEAVLDDTGDAFACYDSEPNTDPTVCTFGSDAPDAVRIAVTGDSHAAMLLPGLREVADAHGWRLDSYVGRGCVWMHLPDDPTCADRRAAVERRLLNGDYAAILVTARNPEDFGSRSRGEIAAALGAAWQTATAAGTTVVALADNPTVPQNSLNCLSTVEVFSWDSCAFARESDRLGQDPVRLAANATGVPLIDLTAAYCTDDTCVLQSGGVVVYRDTHHITATFSRTLAPYLAAKLSDTLPSS